MSVVRCKIHEHYMLVNVLSKPVGGQVVVLEYCPFLTQSYPLTQLRMSEIILADIK